MESDMRGSANLMRLRKAREILPSILSKECLLFIFYFFQMALFK